ncbi:GGDEF domain-containing protein [Actinoplanes sp. NBRC 101535]|uniref:GGDEF domain-containing protein n=1 Tax=Actinoplanes sp. NBRC 101535 TaxID=3032196 RepID=UPI0024A592AD|nr:GGDEF domain-containing protein [Actinoplanes sp. NBRC 101535]GLY00284.1 GGDEF domain-containing protein [Actinoplanes sp. NBRC 101535]
MPYQMRDQHGAARAVAYLMLAAGVYNIITGVLMKLGDPVAELVALGITSTAMLVVGLACLRHPEKMPDAFWLSVPFVSSCVVTGLNLATRDATTGAQLFYLWPLLYAASFLSRRVIAVTIAMISAGHASVAFQYLDGTRAMNDWLAITVAMAMTAIVVASLRERNDRLRDVLEQQATSDALTGAANRRAYDAELARVVAEAAAGGDPVALVTVDVDHFKEVNDTWGHAVGDQALQQVADTLTSAAAGHEHLVARLGGDEFAVLLRAGPAAALRYAEQARADLAAGTGLPSGPPRLSIGIAVLPDHAATADELQRAADAALYEAKAAGRGRSRLARGGPAPRQNVDRMPRPTPARSSSGPAA